jgi:hypothetical protein
VQRQAFLLIQRDGLTLDQAASRLGYKSAAGVSYQYRAALERLRDFCLLWTGLSPPDLDEALFDEFIREIIEEGQAGIE